MTVLLKSAVRSTTFFLGFSAMMSSHTRERHHSLKNLATVLMLVESCCMNDLSWVLPYRTEGLTVIFKIISYLGEEYFFMTFLSIGYWCFNKKLFRDLAVLVCISTMLNVLLKVFFEIPRPSIEHLMYANDYSFPSGHAQVTTVFWLVLAIYYKSTFLRWLAGIIIIGQCLSRIYLGVHFPSDVFVGTIIGVLTVAAYVLYKNSIYWPLFSRNKVATALVFAGSMGLYYFHMMGDSNRNSVATGGALAGIIIGYLMENRFCGFQGPTSYIMKIIVAFVGIATVLELKFALRSVILLNQSFFHIFAMNMILGIYIFYLFPLMLKLISREKVNRHALTK